MRLPSLFAARSQRGLLLMLLGLVAGCDGGIAGPIEPGTGASGSGDCSDRYPLVANAGVDRSVNKNSWTTLDGTGSVDPNGNGALSYRWSLRNPAGGEESLTSWSSPAPSFITSRSGVYRGSLVVSSACASSSPDTVDITVVNRVPVANAGADQTLRKRSVVRPSGSASTDADRDTLSYAWSIASAPAGSTATLADATTVSPTLVPEVPGVYLLSLVVSDGESASAPDTVQVTVFNTVPVAQAGADVESEMRSSVTLAGAGSDADGDALTYQWSFASRPAGSGAALTGAQSATPGFTPDVDGRYELDLVVHDGTDASPADRLVVTVYRYIHRLGYRVVDAEYSRSLERVITVSTSPNLLHVYDPVAETEATVALALAPTCVSVSPDGRYAAVGHDGYVSHVNLETRALVGAPHAVSAKVGDVALSATHAYVIPAVGASGFSYMHSLNLGTRRETIGSNILHDGSQVKLHAAGTALYTVDDGVSPEDLRKYNVGSGAAQLAYDSRYHGDYPLMSTLWLTEDGQRLIAGSGRAFSTVPTATTRDGADLLYSGSLEGYSGYYARVTWVDHDADTNTLAAIPGDDWYDSDPLADTKLQLFSGDFLTLQATLALPRFVLAGRGHPGHGRFVFHSSNGSRRFVLVEADASAGPGLEQGFVAF